MRTNKNKYNGKKPKGNEILKEEYEIKLFFKEEQMDTFISKKQIKKVAIHFEKVYEDEHLLIVNKPRGLLTQKDSPESQSLADEVLYYLKENGSYNPATSQGFTPAPCNRLDRNTAGIVLVGKDIPTLQTLSSMLQTKEISKYYMSIVLGRITSPMTLKGYHKRTTGKNEVIITNEYIEGAKPVETRILPLQTNGRYTLVEVQLVTGKTHQIRAHLSQIGHPIYIEGAKPVETRILPLQTNGRYTLVEVQLVTGKTHQIRAHLSQIGHPIIGDPKYGDALENAYFEQKYGLKYQILCAYKVKFELCKAPLEYLQNRVFTVPSPKIYLEICAGEKLL